MQVAIKQILWIGLTIMAFTQCVHEPIPPSDVGQGSDTDTTGTGGGNNDTTGQGGGNADQPCDPDTAYFQNDILPLLNSSCGVSGCHDPATASDNVILTNYTDIMATADVRPGDPTGSDLYEVLVETDPDKKMPPPGSGISLTNDQINLIYTWIQQGAQNNACDPNAGQCDTINMSYANDIAPVINTHCQGCHNNSVQSGNVNLEGHANVASYANSGQLYGSIAHLPGYKPMPQGQSKLDDCTIKQIKSWIDDGAPNN